MFKTMLITKTPYRLSLYGGGLDYPEWYEKRGARVLCAGLDYHCYLTIRKLVGFFEHNYRATYSKIESSTTVDGIDHPSIREVFRKFANNMSLEVSHIGDLPARSGIGSSSAFTVGLINSVMALRGQYLGKEKLAKSAISIEQNEMGENVGFQDQCAAAYGGVVIVEAGSNGIQPRKFICREEYIKYISENLLMGFDGIPRDSEDSSKIIKKNIQSNSYLSKMIELTSASDSGIELFSKEADIAEHARVIQTCRDIKATLNGGINSSRVQELIEATERAGSLCTKVMGAGGGGFFVCWAPRHKHEQIKASVQLNTWVDVKIDKTGSQVIFAE